MPSTPIPSSEFKINTGDFVASIGAFFLAAGIIGFMLWHFGAVEFLNIILFMFLPIAALLAAVGLVRWGTMKMLYNFELKSRVVHYMEEMRREAARVAPVVAETVTA